MTLILSGTTGISSPGGDTSTSLATTTLTATTVNTQNTFGFKNRIINGAMMIDQRNAGASFTPNSSSSIQYSLDRWNCYATQASKYTVQQNAGSVTPPAGFVNYAGITSSSAYSITSTDIFLFRQYIEGLNCADLAWGTANAATITLSFWVRSSLTGTFGGSLQNSAQNRNYPFSFVINSANTWEQKTVTVAGDTSGTWLTTNGIGIHVNFGIGVGSTYSGTAGAWASGPYWSTTGATSVVGTSGATFYITGVQLEKGSTATSFDYRPYGTELALCQRYYYKYINDSGGAGYFLVMSAYSTTATAGKLIDFPVPMRTAGTAVTSGTFTPLNATGSATTTFTATNVLVSSFGAYAGGWTGSSGLTAGQSVIISMGGTAFIAVSAEL